MSISTVVVTKYPAFVAYLRERGWIDGEPQTIPVITDPSQIEGRHVFADRHVPLALAVHSASVTEVPLDFAWVDVESDDLSLARVRQIAGAAQSYRTMDAFAAWMAIRKAYEDGWRKGRASIRANPYDEGWYADKQMPLPQPKYAAICCEVARPSETGERGT